MLRKGELIFILAIVIVSLARLRGDSRVKLFFMAVALLFVQYDVRTA
jgi:uncharacterized membrane protein YfhO